MAGFFQQVLQGAGSGIINPDGSPYLKDFAHAAKTFTPNAYGHAPKFKWLFHVYFEINKAAITDKIDQIFPKDHNYGLLVKSVELPKFQIVTQELNQYNRKRWIQTKINYEPVAITFHDDNNNVIRNLWYTYYSYHYNDPSQPGGAATENATNARDASSRLNRKNVYDPAIRTDDLNWGYIGEAPAGRGYKPPFFKSVSIYGFNQHNFAQYQLINPIIDSFRHDTYNYASGAETMENSMSLRYESVKYYEGALDGSNPANMVPGFAEAGNYDNITSPISRPGSTRSILGQGGLVDAAGGVINDLARGDLLGALQTVNRTQRTFKNLDNVKAAANSELNTGLYGARVTRGPFNIPAMNATSGTSLVNNGIPSTTAPNISTPPNTPNS
jgi:hypothetical protein